MTKKTVEYPYLPDGRTIEYVDGSNPYIKAAKKYAKSRSLDKHMPTGSVVVYKGSIVGCGANGSNHHDKFGCERVKRGIPTGQGYDLCEGCNPKNHSEPRAIEDAKKSHPEADLSEADLYLWGHWWACEPCWKAIKQAGIKNVYLMSDSHEFFNKDHPNNVVGRQFD